MPRADWIEYDGKTSALLTMIETDIAFEMDCYHRLIQYGAKYRKKMQTARTLNPVKFARAQWAAYQGQKACAAAAAATLARCKAMRRLEEIHLGVVSGTGSPGQGGGFNLDA